MGREIVYRHGYGHAYDPECGGQSLIGGLRVGSSDHYFAELRITLVEALSGHLTARSMTPNTWDSETCVNEAWTTAHTAADCVNTQRRTREKPMFLRPVTPCVAGHSYEPLGHFQHARLQCVRAQSAI
jgi:hypothetical protein